MYLSAELYMSKYSKPELAKTAEKVRALFPSIKLTGSIESVTVRFEVGYWRKANEIHQWFVENCQDGKDDCQEAYVDREQLQELKELCQKVLLSPKIAEKTLPTQSGFFFGSTEYDENYKEDLKHTIQVIDYALSLPAEFDFYYRSSW